MLIRTTVLAVFAALAYAQPPAPAPGPVPAHGHGFGGGGFGEAHFLFAEPGRPGPVVKNAPYSADVVTETVQTLGDGNHIHQTNTAHFYRDSEGRTRREQSFGALGGLATGSDLPKIVFINDPVGGSNYALNPNDHTAMKSGVHAHGGPRGGRQMVSGSTPPPAAGSTPPPAFPSHGPRARIRQNVKTESLGRQTIEGVPADGTRTTLTIPAGQIGNDQPINIVTETWYSPDLQTIVLSKQSDPRHGETTYKLANISRTEPAHSLFEVPVDYKVSERSARPPAPRQ